MSERNLPYADGDILICAFRYALGRMTYMVDHVASFIEANADKLAPETRGLIVREIDDAKRDGALGMDFDEARWLRVRVYLLAGRTRAGSIEGSHGPAEAKQREWMRGQMSRREPSRDHVIGERGGLFDAAHLADAIGRDVLEENRGRKGKGRPTKRGERLAAVAKRVGDAIWAECEAIQVPRREDEPADAAP